MIELLILLGILGVEIAELSILWQISIHLTAKEKTPAQKAPPKARESFVVKRMEQRLKEAMYPNE